MNDNRRFKPGSGCFPCYVCGKLTRDTRNDNTGLCNLCYTIAEKENAEDNGEEVVWTEAEKKKQKEAYEWGMTEEAKKVRQEIEKRARRGLA